jgi:hypothetical protein
VVKKDRLSNVNKTYLMKTISVFYQAHLKSQLSRAKYLFLQILIKVLQAIKNVSVEKLATALPLPKISINSISGT